MLCTTKYVLLTANMPLRGKYYVLLPAKKPLRPKNGELLKSTPFKWHLSSHYLISAI